MPLLGRDPSRDDLKKRREFTAGADLLRLRLFTGIHTPPGAPPPRRHHRALSQSPGVQVQLRQGHLPEMLRSAPPARHQLQEEEVWTHESVEAQEEAEVERERTMRGVYRKGKVVGMGLFIAKMESTGLAMRYWSANKIQDLSE